MTLKKYRLNDGSVHWRKLCFDLMPRWMTKYSPPFGSYNYAAYLYQPREYFRDLYLEVKWFLQRGIRGYSDRDVWGWCDHHSRMMVGVLRHLRKHRHGYPVGLTPAKWDRKLAVMAAGFQAAMGEENDVTSYKKLSRKAHLRLIRARQRKLNLALKYFKEYYCNLWD